MWVPSPRLDAPVSKHAPHRTFDCALTYTAHA